MGSKPVLVLEITDQWVKFLQLIPRGSGWQLGKAACQELTDEQAIAQWIREQVAPLGRRPGSFLAILPRHRVMTRHLLLPSRELEEITRMVALQMPSLVPYAAQEAIWGSQPIRQAPDGYTEVMVAVVPRMEVQRVLRAVEPSGLSIDRISVSNLGLLRWWQAVAQQKPAPSEGMTILIDLDAAALEIDLMDGTVPLFTRGTSFEREGMPQALLAEIRRTLATAARETEGKQVGRVILSGLTSSLEPTVQLLQTELTGEVQIIDSFQPIGQKALPEAIRRCSFTSLLGLAMETSGSVSASQGLISLLPPELLAERTGRSQRIQWAGSLAALGLAVFTGIGAIGWPVISTRIQLKQIQGHLQAMAPSVQEIEGMRQQMETAGEYRLAQGLPLKVLQELYAVVPPQTALTLVILDAKQDLVLKGQAPSMKDVTALVTHLEGSPLFGRVQLRYSNKRFFQGQEIADFEIQCPLSLTGPGGKR